MSYRLLPPPPIHPSRGRKRSLPSYEAAFAAWAREVIAYFQTRKPDREPFDLARFDGCTGIPDLCRHCCLIHDVGYHYAGTVVERRAADKEFQRCLAGEADKEEQLWRWFWIASARACYAGVSAFGGFFWHGGR